MKPVNMDNPFSHVEACVASILECRIDEIPDVSVGVGPHSKVLDELIPFLEDRDLTLCHVRAVHESGVNVVCMGHWIAHGVAWAPPDEPSTQHSVVMEKNKLVHDPDPEGHGLRCVVGATFFNALYPSRKISGHTQKEEKT